MIEGDASSDYTAAEIAAALGWSDGRITAALQSVAGSGTKIVRGKNAKTWRICNLPEGLLQEIERLRQIHRFRTSDDLLRNPTRIWQPPIGLSEICDADIRRADQLRESLGQALQADEATSISQRARIALPEFRRICGHEISLKQLGRLIARTIDRDRGAHDFARLEIYLPEIPRLQQKRSLADVDFQELRDEFATIADRRNPTVEERSFCWRKIIAHFAKRGSEGEKPNELKNALCKFVFAQLPALGKNTAAIDNNLRRKLASAKERGLEALIDQRPVKSGKRREHDACWDENITKLARHIRGETGGRISQGYRELFEGTGANGARLSEEFRERYCFDPRGAKSDVPAAIRAAVRPRIKATDAIHRGPKAARLSGPSFRRDWSNVFAGDSYSADDFTLNHPFIEWDEAGEFIFEGRRFNLTRGQTLIFCDERSLRIPGYYLTPRPNYGAGTICAGINRICMDEAIGLPFRRFLFERGAWKARAVKSAVDWARIDQVFSKEGVEFGSRESGAGLPGIVHATTPKAKIIERIGGAVQSLMEGAPAYVGRNQRLDGPERTATAMARLRRLDQRCKPERDPRKDFLTKEQFCAELEDVVRRFNAEPQNGKMLDGLSPEEGWKELHPSPRRAHRLLPESLRYLLSTEKAEVKVTDEGVKLVRRGQPARHYSGHRLGELIGEKVRVRFNSETPEMITVCHLRSDPKELRPFSVSLDPSIPAIDATQQDFDRARGARQKFRQYGRDVYRVIAPRSNVTVLAENTGSPDVRRTAEAHVAAKREHDALSSARSRAGREAQKMAARHGIHVDASKLQRPERALQAARNLDESEERCRRIEAGTEESEDRKCWMRSICGMAQKFDTVCAPLHLKLSGCQDSGRGSKSSLRAIVELQNSRTGHTPRRPGSLCSVNRRRINDERRQSTDQSAPGCRENASRPELREPRTRH